MICGCTCHRRGASNKKERRLFVSMKPSLRVRDKRQRQFDDARLKGRRPLQVQNQLQRRPVEAGRYKVKCNGISNGKFKDDLLRREISGACDARRERRLAASLARMRVLRQVVAE
jgi:hypothetical protein